MARAEVAVITVMMEPKLPSSTQKDMPGHLPTYFYLPTHGKSSSVTTAKFGSKKDVHQKRKDRDGINLDINKKTVNSDFKNVHNAISMS